MVSWGEAGPLSPAMSKGHSLSCKEEEEKEFKALPEVSGVWGGPSSSPPRQGCCHQPEKVTMASVTNLARARGLTSYGPFLAGWCQFGPKSLYRLPKAHCTAVYFNKGA